MKNLTPDQLTKAPAGFKAAEIKPKAVEGLKAALVIAAEDCYDCGVCLNVCPMSKDAGKPMALTLKSYADDAVYHAEQKRNFSIFNTEQKKKKGSCNHPGFCGYKNWLV